MSSKRSQILQAFADRVKTIPSYSSIGSVNIGARNYMQVRDQPSVDLVMGNEDREQQPSFQAKRTTGLACWVWGRLGEDVQTEDLCEEIENAVRDEMTLGGLVTASYATSLISDEGTLAKEGVGSLRVIEFHIRYHQTEM